MKDIFSLFRRKKDFKDFIVKAYNKEHYLNIKAKDFIFNMQNSVASSMKKYIRTIKIIW